MTKPMQGKAVGPFSTEKLDDEPDFVPDQRIARPEADGGGDKRRDVATPYVLSFVGGDHVPKPGVDPRLTRLKKTRPGGVTYGYVMIEGRMSHPTKLRVLRNLGVTLYVPHTYQSWAAKIPLDRLDRIAALPFVRWIGYAQPSQKIDPLLAKALDEAEPVERFQIDISTFESDWNRGSRTVPVRGPQLPESDGTAVVGPLQRRVPGGPFQRALEAAGFVFADYTDVGNVHVFHGSATKGAIDKIRELDFVAFVEAKQVHRLAHDQSMSMIGQDSVRARFGGGLITQGVIDTGWQVRANKHRDLNKWGVGWSSWSADAFLDGHGHGTHVLGTMAGDGTANAAHRGAAPSTGRTGTSRLFVGRYFDDNGRPQGNVASLYSVMSRDFSDGTSTSLKPRAINNSWGAGAPTGGWVGSESGARTVDSYVYTHNQCYVFASGNSGSSTNFWCMSPGSAKNALTVGSVDDFASGSIRPGNETAFTSHRTKDGRRKPEIAAPGRYVTSTSNRSASAYRTMQGTSMAAPHITGMIASFVENRKSWYDYRPFAIKAALLGVAEDQGSPGNSTGWMRYRTGYGVPNAQQLHYGTSKSSWAIISDAGNIKNSGQWQYWEGVMPTDVQHIKVVMNWIEVASSPGATKAVVNDLDLYVDVFPFSNGGNTGDYSARSTNSNVESISLTSLATAARGKRVRFKVYARNATSAVKWGMFVMMHRKSPFTAAPSLTTSVGKTILKPRESTTLTGTVRAGTAGDFFDNVRLYPSLASGWSATRMERRMADNVLNLYTGTSHPSYPYPNILGGMTIGQGDSRWLRWTVQAPPTSGRYTLSVRGDGDPGNFSLNRSQSVCVDGLAPSVIPSLRSTTHPVNVWRNNTRLAMIWGRAVDNGCAGIDGCASRATVGSTSAPTVRNLSATATAQTVTVAGSASRQYFCIRAIDRAGNYSGTACYGPFYVDTSRPVLSRVTINGGATYATSRSVSVVLAASDTFSGVSQVRFSCDNRTWTSWQTYRASGHSFVLCGTSDGTQTVYAQVRDKALNTSAVASDSIVYDATAPVISSVAINGGAAWTNSSAVRVSVSASDRASGLGSIRYSFNGATWTGWMSYASTRSMTLPVGDGTKAVYAQVRDRAGRTSSVRSDSIGLDTARPIVSSVLLNDAAACTNNRTVQVKNSASDSLSGLRYVEFSLDNRNWGTRRGYSSGPHAYQLAATEGNQTVWVRVIDAAGNVSASRADSIELDTVAPVVSALVLAGGSTCTNARRIDVRTTASDAGCGLGDMEFSLDGTNWEARGPFAATRSYLLADTQGVQRVFVRVYDKSGNVSAPRSATIQYDSVAPVVTTVVINRGARFTNSLSVVVMAAATDAGCGPAEMRYAETTGNWGAWLPFTTGNRPISLLGSRTGTRTIHVQVRDRAGNISAPRSDTIDYYPTPVVRSAAPAAVEVVQHTKVVLSGIGLADVTSVRFGTRTITSGSSDDWVNGYFKVLSDTAMELYTPQGLAPTTYSVRVANAGSSSAPFQVAIRHNAGRTLGVPRQLALGKTLDVLVHRGGMPAATFDLLTLSASGRGLNVPGVVNLAHGGNATTFIDPTFTILAIAVPHDPTTRVARWRLPAAAAATFHFQALMFDPLDIDRRPIVTSTGGATRVY